MRYRSDLQTRDVRPRTGEHSHVRIRYGLGYYHPNPLPTFSVTVERSTERGGKPGDGTSGAAHELILDVAPDLADVVALHLSDLHGAPMHDVANGWYWYTDSDGKGTHLDRYPARTPFARMSPHERAAHHLRIDPADLPVDLDTREEFAAFVDTLREAWRREADAVVAKYGLDPGGPS